LNSKDVAAKNSLNEKPALVIANSADASKL
jgi:hypothetical protein